MAVNQLHSGKAELNRRYLWRRGIVTVLLWAAFFVGLGIQSLAPGLKIDNNKFVLPGVLTADSPPLHPDEIVTRERRVQWTSGLLTLGSAICLALWYRRAISSALVPRGPHSQGR